MKRRTTSQWQVLIEVQLQSGMTATEFCKRHGINDNYFSLLKQKFRQSEPEAKGFAVAQIAPLKQKTGYAVVSLPANLSPVWLADFVKALPNALLY